MKFYGYAEQRMSKMKASLEYVSKYIREAVTLRRGSFAISSMLSVTFLAWELMEARGLTSY